MEERSPLKLSVAGKDRSGDLGRLLVRTAALRSDDGLARLLEREAPVPALLSLDGPESFARRLLEVLRSRHAVDLDRFTTPAAPGWAGRLRLVLRRALWRLLRYQHDWVAFHANAVHAQLLYLAEFELAEREQQVAELTRRIERLEAAAGSTPPTREVPPC